jgi:circadian clock protein KaiC
VTGQLFFQKHAEKGFAGIKELDALLGGGLDRGTSNMFMGPPGTGKSTIAIKFAIAAAQRREKVLFFAFDETIGTMKNRAAHLGMDMEAHTKSGMIHVEQTDPAEISPGELAHRIRDAITKDKTRMVIIDSINGYLNAMPEERYLNLQLHELLAFLNQQGVITNGAAQRISRAANDSGPTYLADTNHAALF